jgi:uncharacterized protein (UPF0305 family)
MNDFTKEELKQILHGIYRANNEDLPVALKVQSMIDNYCEHVKGIEFPGMCSICKKDLCFECGKML